MKPTFSVRRAPHGFWLVVGPWACRFSRSPGGTFGWREGDGWMIRKSRKWFSGWHRWDEREA